jgi:hypothetical protein
MGILIWDETKFDNTLTSMMEYVLGMRLTGGSQFTELLKKSGEKTSPVRIFQRPPEGTISKELAKK